MNKERQSREMKNGNGQNEETRSRNRQNREVKNGNGQNREEESRNRQSREVKDGNGQSEETWRRNRQNGEMKNRNGQNEETQRRDRQNGESENGNGYKRESGKVNRQNGGLQKESRLSGSWQEEEWAEGNRHEEERKEKERQLRRRRRIEQMKREKRRREIMFRYGVPAAAICFLLLFVGIIRAVRPKEGGEDEHTQPAVLQEAVSTVLQYTQPGRFSTADTVQPGNLSTMDEAVQLDITSAIRTTLLKVAKPVFEAHVTENTNGFSDNIISEYGIMIDVGSGEVLAQKGGWTRINPASMTKILTVLVAAEHITDLEDTFTMTVEITDYSYIHGCSNAGFEVGEEIPIKDLFYGTALPSGADAALGLAFYVAGSQEAFVDMMNAKLEELGLSETTHFTNCIGLYDENHYSTPYDMAVILKEAADNEFCRQVLSEHYYVTTPTAEHSEGLRMSNLFLRRIEDRDTHGEVLCAKTGYVKQSKNCAASLAADHNGREYICVTVGSNNVWTCIRDQVELYQRYLPE